MQKREKGRSLRKDTEGSAWAWAVVLLSIVGLTVLWGVMLPTMALIQDISNSTMMSTVEDANNSTTVQQVQRIQGRVFIAYEWYILFALAGLFIWGFVYSIYRESGRW